MVNFIPARISAYLMIAAAFIGGRQFDGKMHTASLKEIVSITQAQTQPRQSPYVREL